jgi:membrane-associated phospholipid phosphatase
MKAESLVTWLMAVASLILIVATEPFYREVLFNASIPTIITLQSTATPESIHFFKVVSDVGAIGLTFGVIIASYVWLERNKAFYFLTYFGEIMVIMGIGKMAYHSPRPYMVSDDVQVYGCSTEFGHPSGHSINDMTFCIGFLLDRIASNPNDSCCGRIL